MDSKTPSSLNFNTASGFIDPCSEMKHFIIKIAIFHFLSDIIKNC